MWQAEENPQATNPRGWQQWEVYTTLKIEGTNEGSITKSQKNL